jgi:hypothetical protein
MIGDARPPLSTQVGRESAHRKVPKSDACSVPGVALPSAQCRFLYPRKEALRTDHEGSVQAIFAGFNLLHYAIIRSVPHPPWAWGR